MEKNKKLTLSEKIGGMLFSIHHHHPETEKIIYYEEDIIQLLKALGHPEPTFGNVLSIKDFKKTYKPKKIPWWLSIKKGKLFKLKFDNDDKYKYTGEIYLSFKRVQTKHDTGHYWQEIHVDELEETLINIEPKDE